MTTRLLREKPRTLADVLSGRKRPRRAARWPWIAGIALALVGVPSIFYSWTSYFGVGHVPPGINKVKAATPAIDPRCARPVAPLQDELAGIAQSFNGRVGVAVSRVGCDWIAGERLTEYFPQQSVSKLWVSLAVLDAVDRGKLRLDQAVTIGPQDLTLFHQPLRSEVLESGTLKKPVLTLMTAALSRSDNTANDRLLWTVGGPDAVRGTLEQKGLHGLRFGPGERLLQTGIAGLRWSQEMSLGRNFEQARARLPQDHRHKALSAYLADPMDGAMPSGMVRALSRLADGDLLSPASTTIMMDILSTTHSGPRRLKAGAAEGWAVYHKTGTGQDLGPVSTGYNDVGILQAPDGTRYAVAVMIASTAEPVPVRMDMMQEVSRAVARFHDSQQTDVAGGAVEEPGRNL